MRNIYNKTQPLLSSYIDFRDRCMYSIADAIGIFFIITTISLIIISPCLASSQYSQVYIPFIHFEKYDDVCIQNIANRTSTWAKITCVSLRFYYTSVPRFYCKIYSRYIIIITYLPATRTTLFNTQHFAVPFHM